MASQVNLQCLTAAAATTTDARSMGRTAMATEDRVADPCLFSTMSENNLLSPTNKCIVTGEQQPWTPSSTPFQRYSHEVRNPMQVLRSLICMHACVPRILLTTDSIQYSVLLDLATSKLPQNSLLPPN